MSGWFKLEKAAAAATTWPGLEKPSEQDDLGSIFISITTPQGPLLSAVDIAESNMLHLRCFGVQNAPSITDELKKRTAAIGGERDEISREASSASVSSSARRVKASAAAASALAEAAAREKVHVEFNIPLSRDQDRAVCAVFPVGAGSDSDASVPLSQPFERDLYLPFDAISRFRQAVDLGSRLAATVSIVGDDPDPPKGASLGATKVLQRGRAYIDFAPLLQPGTRSLKCVVPVVTVSDEEQTDGSSPARSSRVSPSRRAKSRRHADIPLRPSFEDAKTCIEVELEFEKPMFAKRPIPTLQAAAVASQSVVHQRGSGTLLQEHDSSFAVAVAMAASSPSRKASDIHRDVISVGVVEDEESLSSDGEDTHSATAAGGVSDGISGMMGRLVSILKGVAKDVRQFGTGGVGAIAMGDGASRSDGIDGGGGGADAAVSLHDRMLLSLQASGDFHRLSHRIQGAVLGVLTEIFHRELPLAESEYTGGSKSGSAAVRDKTYHGHSHMNRTSEHHERAARLLAARINQCYGRVMRVVEPLIIESLDNHHDIVAEVSARRGGLSNQALALSMRSIIMAECAEHAYQIEAAAMRHQNRMLADKSAGSWLGYSLFLMRRGQLRGAHECIRKAYAVDLRNPVTCFLLGAVFLERDLVEDAHAHIEFASEAFRDHPVAVAMLALYYDFAEEEVFRGVARSKADAAFKNAASVHTHHQLHFCFGPGVVHSWRSAPSVDVALLRVLIDLNLGTLAQHVWMFMKEELGCCAEEEAVVPSRLSIACVIEQARHAALCKSDIRTSISILAQASVGLKSRGEDERSTETLGIGNKSSTSGSVTQWYDLMLEAITLRGHLAFLSAAEDEIAMTAEHPAIACYRKARKLAAKISVRIDFRVSLNLGILLLQSGGRQKCGIYDRTTASRFREARAIFLELCCERSHSRNSFVWSGLGAACLRLKMWDDAESALAHATALDSNNSIAYGYLALLALVRRSDIVEKNGCNDSHSVVEVDFIAEARLYFQCALRLGLDYGDLLLELGAAFGSIAGTASKDVAASAFYRVLSVHEARGSGTCDEASEAHLCVAMLRKFSGKSDEARLHLKSLVDCEDVPVQRREAARRLLADLA